MGRIQFFCLIALVEFVRKRSGSTFNAFWGGRILKNE